LTLNTAVITSIVGIQEDVSVLQQALGSASIFTLVVIMGTAFFTTLATMGIYDMMAIRSDVIAGSMSLLSMHDDVEISIGWDYTPFSIGVMDGGLIMVTDSKEHPLSPYPEVIPVSGSVNEGGFEVFSSRDPKSFNFTSLGEAKGVEVN
jgi:hypothetical protein